MCMGNGTTILQAIGRMYPGCLDLDQACRHCGDAERMCRTVEQLRERGFVAARPLSSDGLSAHELRLTEAGMAVAFGLACIEEDASAAIAARERRLLRELDRVRASRLGALAVRGVPPSAAAANPHGPVPNPERPSNHSTSKVDDDGSDKSAGSALADKGAARCKSEPS
ncbi:MAG TPA: hypothetical protein VL624_07090 [Caldimonas sp.]|nr:hypothetical protein [Caldimonas sp.]